MAEVASDDLCAADYVRLLLLSNFKGRTEVVRLENFIKRNASADIKAILECTGGLRPFLEDNQQFFTVDSTSVSVNQKGRPSKENEVVRWLRGRLQTSPRKIFSIPSLQTIVQRGPDGVCSYFAISCPTVEKLREWFLQRSPLFRETPAGNICLSELPVPLTASSPLWLTIDFFVNILDEQGTGQLAIDWSCVFNCIFIADHPAIGAFVSTSYDETTFEAFFRSYPEQFGLEVVDGQLRRSADPANSGMQSPAGGIDSTLNDLDSEVPVIDLCVKVCRDLFNGRAAVPVAELQRSFSDEAPRPLLSFMQKAFPGDRFVDFLAKKDNVFVLSDNRQKVQLRETAFSWNGKAQDAICAAFRSELRRNPKFDNTLVRFFADLLTVAARRQGVRSVPAEKLLNCVQFLPKPVVQYAVQTYRPASQLFVDHADTFSVTKNRQSVSLRAKVECDADFDPTAEATLAVNFFLDVLAALAEHNIRFVQPVHLDLLTCLMAPAAQAYLEHSFGKGQLRTLLNRFPAFFCESKSGNVYLKDRTTATSSTCREPNLDPGSEVVTKIKALCAHPVEGSAVEFFLYEIEARRSFCYPLPITWCATTCLPRASRSVAAYIDEYYGPEGIAKFLAKYPALFAVAPELDAVFLQKDDQEDWNNNERHPVTNKKPTEVDDRAGNPIGEGCRNRNTKGRPQPTRPEDCVKWTDSEKLLVGLVAAQCLAKCDELALTGIPGLARKCNLGADIEAVLSSEAAGAEGRTRIERLQTQLRRFPSVVSVDEAGERVRLRARLPSSGPDPGNGLVGALDTTLSVIVRNTVVFQTDDQNRIPSIMSVFDSVQRICRDGMFPRVMRTLSNFLDFLDRYPAVFIVNGSLNTIAVRGHPVKAAVANGFVGGYIEPYAYGQQQPQLYQLEEEFPQGFQDFGDAQVTEVRRPPGEGPPTDGGLEASQAQQAWSVQVAWLRQWTQQKTTLLSNWSVLNVALKRFVSRMDFDSITRFAGLETIADAMASCLTELQNADVSGPGWTRAQQLVDLYNAKNATFVDFALTAHKVLSFVTDKRYCQRPGCGCRHLADVQDFESFILSCLSVRVHLDEGPLPQVLTPSTSSSSTSSTPDILNRLTSWSESGTNKDASAASAQPDAFGLGGIDLSTTDPGMVFSALEEKTRGDARQRLEIAAREQLSASSFGLNTVTSVSPPCWPRNIWEPMPGELSCWDRTSSPFPPEQAVAEGQAVALPDTEPSSVQGNSSSRAPIPAQAAANDRIPEPPVPAEELTYRIVEVSEGRLKAESEVGLKLEVEWNAEKEAAVGDRLILTLDRQTN